MRSRSESPALARSFASIFVACALGAPFTACSSDSTTNAGSDGGTSTDGATRNPPPNGSDGSAPPGHGDDDSGTAPDTSTDDDASKSDDGGTTAASSFDVMTWVAPYNQDQWKAALQKDTGGAHSPKNTLTRIAAQFWQVHDDGSVSLGASEDDARWVADYSHQNGIKFLTCIHNYDNGWNWGMAVSGFDNNRSKLVASIVKATDDWNADGADIDFEGNEEGEGNQVEFTAFVKELGGALHAKGRILTVDSFADQWNKPHPSWWGDWKGYVDGIQSMQYDGGFGGATDDWASYKGQQDNALKAGYESSMLAIGMPSWKSDWGFGGMGTSIMDHMNELTSGNYNTQPTSVAIWYAAFEADGWLSADVWDALAQIRSGKLK